MLCHSLFVPGWLEMVSGKAGGRGLRFSWNEANLGRELLSLCDIATVGTERGGRPGWRSVLRRSEVEGGGDGGSGTAEGGKA